MYGTPDGPGAALTDGFSQLEGPEPHVGSLRGRPIGQVYVADVERRFSPMTDAPSPTAADLSAALADSAETLAGSIVRIATGRRPATGTVYADDLVVTAAHRLPSRREDAVVRVGEENRPGVIVGRDTATDVALIRVEGGGLTVPTWIDTDDVRVANLVLALGAGRTGVHAALGIVSSLGGPWRTPTAAEIARRIDVDGALPRGGSGGPLADLGGDVLGLNTAGLVRGGTTIPTETVRSVVEKLLSPGGLKRGRLGVAIQPVALSETAAEAAGQERALLVTGLEDGGAADAAGVLLGDALLAVDGVRVHRFEELATVLAERGDTDASLTILRAGAVVEVPVHVAVREGRKRAC